MQARELGMDSERLQRISQVLAADVAAERYDGGVVDYLEVLDSERTLFQAELDESNNGVLIPVTIPPRGTPGEATPIPPAGGTFNGITSGTSGVAGSCDTSTGTSPEEIFETEEDLK